MGRVLTFSSSKKHRDEAELELDMLKEGMKRIERIAIIYSPLEDEMGLLGAIEEWKKEYVNACTRLKRRRRKEEKYGSG
jgi:hypothetical protein